MKSIKKENEVEEEKKNKKKVGFQIKALRNKNKITQAKFYQETDIHIGRLETGKYDVCLKTLRKIVKIFHTSLSSFFTKVEKNK